MLAFDVDLAAVLFDDVVGDGQTETDPLPHILGGKERVPDLVHERRGDSAAAVTDGGGHHAVSFKGGNFDGTRPVDGLEGVHGQVQEDLPQSRRIPHDHRQVLLQGFPYLDVFIAGLVPDQLQDIVKDLVDINEPDGSFRFPAEAQQTVDNPLAPVRFADNDFQVFPEVPE